MFNTKIVYFICCLLLPIALFAGDVKPQLILHFDVNRTLIMVDPVGGKSTSDCIMNTLADIYTDKWDDRVLEPICYSDYIRKYVLPGSEAQDPSLKRLRSQKIAQFLNFLIETNHHLAKNVKGDFVRVLEKLEKQSTLVLTSFYRLLGYLEENEYQYSIVLRTFGSDLKEVMDDIEGQMHSDFFSAQGVFKEGKYHLDTSSDLAAMGVAAFYDFLKNNPHVAVQDDWAPWNRSGKMQAFGKLFPIDLEDRSVVSIFFDDNVVIERNGFENIVNPVNVQTMQMMDVYELIQNHRIFVVDTMEAIEDDGYYIRLVQQALERDTAINNKLVYSVH